MFLCINFVLVFQKKNNSCSYCITMSKLNSKQFKKKMVETRGSTESMENMQEVVQYTSVKHFVTRIILTFIQFQQASQGESEAEQGNMGGGRLYLTLLSMALRFSLPSFMTRGVTKRADIF